MVGRYKGWAVSSGFLCGSQVRAVPDAAVADAVVFVAVEPVVVVVAAGFVDLIVKDTAEPTPEYGSKGCLLPFQQISKVP